MIEGSVAAVAAWWRRRAMAVTSAIASAAVRAAAAFMFGVMAGGPAAAHAELVVCMAGNNPPLSWLRDGRLDGLDVRVAQAVADELRRPLRLVPFESRHEGESTLSQEVNALLSSGVCEMASGFALLGPDLGAPVRPTARVPDHPGAARRPQRPWVALGTLRPSRAYHAMAMGLVVRDPARRGITLADPGDARIGAVSGTLSGTAVALFRHGRLRAQTVGIAQNRDVLEALEAGEFDATLIPFTRFDAWRLDHPASRLQRADYVHPLRINIGLVALQGAAEPLAAADRAIERALANGDLPRWAEAAGATWVAPVEPQVSGPVGLMELLRE